MSDTVIHTVTARSTRTSIDIVRLGEEVDGNSWGAQCTDHGWIIHTTTRRQAHAEGRHPEVWCEDCQAAQA